MSRGQPGAIRGQHPPVSIAESQEWDQLDPSDSRLAQHKSLQDTAKIALFSKHIDLGLAQLHECVLSLGGGSGTCCKLTDITQKLWQYVMTEGLSAEGCIRAAASGIGVLLMYISTIRSCTHCY